MKIDCGKGNKMKGLRERLKKRTGLLVLLAILSCGLFDVTGLAETTTTTTNINSAKSNSYTGMAGAGTSNPSSTYNEGGYEGPAAESGERYNVATTTNPFLMPGNTWVPPVATHGQDVLVVLPIVNMFKYNISDVIVTPRLGVRTDDFPFEINNTGYTLKIGTLLGEDAQPSYIDRVYNCAWTFRTRENVKTGYYKLDFDITYTDPSCAVDTTVISVFVKTVGLPENGTVDGDEDKRLSTPRLIVKGFSTTPKEIYSGEQFTLNLVIENTSSEVTVKNVQLDLTATVEGSQTQASYAAFLPTSGSNSFYIESIPPEGTADLTMDFEAKAGLEQKPYVMTIDMKYEDERANPYDGKGSVSIPVKQVSKYDVSPPTCEPSVIDIGEQSNLMFSVFNTGKTTLYNVQVTVSDPSLQPALAYVGNLSPGATGNVDVMLTGMAYSEMPGATVPIQISYEDESGNVTKDTRPINLSVEQSSIVEEEMPGESMPEEEAGLKVWQKVLIAVGAVLLLAVILTVVIKLIRKKKKQLEEDELAAVLEEIDEEEEAAERAVHGKNGNGAGSSDKSSDEESAGGKDNGDSTGEGGGEN